MYCTWPSITTGVELKKSPAIFHCPFLVTHINSGARLACRILASLWRKVNPSTSWYKKKQQTSELRNKKFHTINNFCVPIVGKQKFCSNWNVSTAKNRLHNSSSVLTTNMSPSLLDIIISKPNNVCS